MSRFDHNLEGSSLDHQGETPESFGYRPDLQTWELRMMMRKGIDTIESCVSLKTSHAAENAYHCRQFSQTRYCNMQGLLHSRSLVTARVQCHI